MKIKSHKKAFTLLELLVVIAIIGLLSTIVLASVSSARERARIASIIQFDNSVRNKIGVNLVAAYSFDQTSSTIVPDNFGNNDGTISGSVSFVDGTLKKAASFNGSTSNYVSIGTSSNLLLTGNQTISMWLYPLDFNQRRNPLHKSYTGELSITQNRDGTINYYYGPQSISSYVSMRTAKPLELNKWNHIMFVRDINNGKITFYLNGEFINHKVNSNFYSEAKTSQAPLIIGSGYSAAYNGYIDEVKIYNEAYRED